MVALSFKDPITRIEIHDTETKLDGRLALLKRLFSFTLLMFRYDHTKNKVSKPRLLIAVFLALICTYQVSFLFYYTIGKKKESLANVLSEVSWAFQSLISVYFVIYWQFGHFQDVFSIKTWAAFNLKTSEHVHRKTWKTYTMFSIFAIFTVLMGTFVAFAYYSDNMKTYDMDKNLYEGMGPGTGILSVIISIFHGIVWTLVFMFYVLVLSILSQVLEAFNNEVKKIGNKEDIKTELLIQYDRLVNMTSLVWKINSVFEIYTFIMIATNVPVTIFSLINFINIQGEFISKLFYLPEIFYCLFEAFALTIPPAKIYTEAKMIQSNFYSNKKIWRPYNQDNYQIGSIIVDYSKQDLGITLWRYSMMSRSLILTIFSMTVSYLLIVTSRLM